MKPLRVALIVATLVLAGCGSGVTDPLANKPTTRAQAEEACRPWFGNDEAAVDTQLSMARTAVELGGDYQYVLMRLLDGCDDTCLGDLTCDHLCTICATRSLDWAFGR